MATPLGQSNTPSFLGLHPASQPQTFCILFPTPKGIAQRAYPVHQSTTAFLTAIAASDIEKSPGHPQRFPTPILLLWWCHQHPLTFPWPQINRRRDFRVGTVQIIPEEGEISHFLAFACIEIHEDLTNPSQSDA
jgi:hypothetical protein